jgi:hypothetical protein
VRSSYLDAGRRTHVANTERHHRSGYCRKEQYRFKSLGGKDFSGGQRELLGAVSGITTDDDPRLGEAVVLEDLGDCPGGSQHDCQIHPVGSATQGAPQTRGPEPQRLSESLLELFVAARRQLGSGLRVGVMGNPLLRGR